jgi:hypothetical protein
MRELIERRVSRKQELGFEACNGDLRDGTGRKAMEEAALIRSAASPMGAALQENKP